MYVHPEFRKSLMEQRVELLRSSGSPPRRVDTAPTQPLLIRLCRSADDPALDRLAALEGAPAPSGRFVVAELQGTVVAALPLDGGAPLADPFLPTRHLISLLSQRAAQVRQHESPRGRRLLRRLTQTGSEPPQACNEGWGA
jgi:hypothetical protein